MVEFRHGSPRSLVGERDGASVLVHVRAPLREPERDFEGRVVDGARERRSQLARRHPVELAEQVRDVRAREPRREQSREERDRQRDLADDLPPVDLLREVRHVVHKRREELVERSHRGHDRGEEDRREDALSPLRGAHEAPHQQDHEAYRQRAEDDDRERLLDCPRELGVPPDEDGAVRPEGRVRQPRSSLVHEQRRVAGRAPSCSRPEAAGGRSDRAPGRSGRRAPRARRARKPAHRVRSRS
jgi:hypothetical protein